MAIEIQFNSVTIEYQDMQENYPLMFSSLQQYLPAQKALKKRRPRKKTESIASLIDAVIDSME